MIIIPSVIYRKKDFSRQISLWGRGLVKILGINVIEKNKKPEQSGDIIISNHYGLHEIPVLLSYYPAIFAVKDQCRKSFVTGRMLKKVGNIFIDPENPSKRTVALIKLVKKLKRGKRVIVFPEGEFTPGSKRKPFNAGPFHAAKKMNKKIQACVIDSPNDRNAISWNKNGNLLFQLFDFFSRKKVDVSIRFFDPVTVDEDPAKFANKWKRKIEMELEKNEMENIVPDEERIFLTA